MKLLHKGAEAILYQQNDKIIKERIAKKYRHKQLDIKLRKQRTKQEFNILKKAYTLGISVPEPLSYEGFKIVMKHVEGKDLKTEPKKDVEKNIAEILSSLHNHNIIHGDVTLKNFIFCKKDKKLYIIDFGLSFISSREEDKAMDLFVLEETSKDSDINIEKIIDYYNAKNKEKIIERLEKIRKRRRYF